MKIKYKLKHIDNKTRYGVIKTKYGEYETPMFMPVGTQATVKTLSPSEIKSIGSGIILSNTYHLWLRPGEDLVNKAGGVHKFMNYNGPMLTDSGGYQVFSLKDKQKITEEGVEFKSHIDGSKLFLSPEKSIQIQNKIGADIIMSFDECPPFPVTKKYMKDSVDRTLRWAKRGKEAHKNKDQALFGIVQGGEFEDLRKYSAEETIKIGFDGYSIGGVANGGEGKEKMYMAVEYAVKYLPEDKLRYLMGVGEPIDLLEGVERGIDIFDCVLPSRIARHGHVFTRNGKLNMKNIKHKEDFTPIEEDCDCYACQNHTKAYINHLFKAKESYGQRLLTIHNLRFLIRETEEIREAIQNNNFSQYKEDFIKKYNK